MYSMSWRIKVGGFRLSMLERVEITRSVEQLSDTAIITLPGTCFNKAIEIEQQIKRGDRVTIELGYDGNLLTEFDGFLDSVSTNDGNIILSCEDALFLFKAPVGDKQFISADVQQVLSYLLPSGYSLKCDYSFKYDQFIIRSKTAFQVLKQIHEETKANIYLKGKELHVHPQYTELFGSAVYSFQSNIESSELEYHRAEDRKIEVTVEGKDRSGKVLRETAGEKGGDAITIKIQGVSDLKSLRNLAEEQLKIKSYTGYSGSFTGWLIPYCDAGYKVAIFDKEYEYKNGSYYATQVKVTFSQEGGKRIITLGKRI